MARSGRESGDPAEWEARRAALVGAARERFASIGRLPEPDIDLAEAALVIAAEEYPGLDIDAYLRRLDELAERVRRRIAASHASGAPDPDEAALNALHHVLFEEEGFTGAGLANPDDYYRPRNSFLNEVLDRKEGLPITLSLIYCEVARRAGLDAVGINAPGHFLAQFRGRHLSVLIDPYHGGTRVEPGRLGGDLVVPAPKKAILARLLTNLKLVYVQRQQYMKALSAVERILVLLPAPSEVRDRGIILRALGEQLLQQGRERFLREKDAGPAAAEEALQVMMVAMQHAQQLLGSAWFDLSLYARLSEGTAGAESIATTTEQLWRLLGRHN